MQNDPAPKKYLKQGFSPLHSHALCLFDSLEHEYHQCAVDNLYRSASFCGAAYNHEKKALCHGVTGKGCRSMPGCVQQEEQKSKADQRSACVTVKAAVLEGDTECPCLVASSVYDSKPVYYLSMVTHELKWVVKQKMDKLILLINYEEPTG
eukprot:3162387-Ditylum_brightwellii.AAC.1